MARIRDGDWWLVDHDFQLGRTVWARTNGDGSTTYRTDYNVEKTLEINAKQKTLAENNWKGDYHHVASIPLNVFHDQLAEASRQRDDKYLSKWLNDSDNAAWRTKEGRV
ncbi:hypothetical protein [Celeribacter sp. SCSIO 80788]|uniref:hypothetical protein n=1 Tax=Celeribacter sp. SCSIO 80788 TaxID=3117013 RepID=UPI003DA4FD15